MIKVKSRTSVLLWLISLTADARVISPFYLESNNANVLEGNEPELIVDSYNGKSFNERDRESNRKSRLSEAEWSTYNLREPNGRGTYAFGYDNVIDPAGNEQYRSEEKLKNGTVVGEYGYTDFQNQRLVRVTYTADLRGYRAKTEILPLDDFRARAFIYGA